MKKILCIFMIISLVFCFSSCKTENSSSKTENNVSSTDNTAEEIKTTSKIEENVRTLGRTAVSKDGLWLSWSGSGIEFETEESELYGDFHASLVFGADYRVLVGVFLDGKSTFETSFTVGSKTEHIKLFSNKSGKHKVSIIKLSEAQYGSLCIEKIDGKIAKTAENPRKFEFIGDSLVCGFGTRSKSPRGDFNTVEEDVSLTAYWLLANEYGADADFVCATGYGVSDDSNGKKKNLISNIYEKNAPFYEAQKNLEEYKDYDFSAKYEAIFINLGYDQLEYTHDESEKLRFTQAYTNFLKTVRKHNPDSKIIVFSGTMSFELNDMTEQSVNELHDSNMYFYKFGFLSPTIFSGVTGGRPSAKSHTRMLKELKTFMTEIGINKK